jgi:hypothetical protein
LLPDSPVESEASPAPEREPETSQAIPSASAPEVTPLPKTVTPLVPVTPPVTPPAAQTPPAPAKPPASQSAHVSAASPVSAEPLTPAADLPVTPVWESRPPQFAGPAHTGPLPAWKPRPAPILGQPAPVPDVAPVPDNAPVTASAPPIVREAQPAEPAPQPQPTRLQPAPGEAEPVVAQDPALRPLEVSHDGEPANWLVPSADLPAWRGPAQQPDEPSRHGRGVRLPRFQQRPAAGRATSQPSQPSQPVQQPQPPQSSQPNRTGQANKAKVVDLDAERPLPSIERALNGPGGGRELGWRRRVKVVAGGQGPGKRDQESLDRDRARLPLAGPRWIVVLGCTGGAGQTMTALVTGRLLASLRQHPVAAIGAACGTRSEVTVAALLAGSQSAGSQSAEGSEPSGTTDDGLDIITDDGTAHGDDYQRLAGIVGDRYPLTIVDPEPPGLTRVLSLADQLVIVVPAVSEASSSLANTQQWLDAHGYGDLAARAVTLLNGVHRDVMNDVLRAESVARGRCRAIVRVPKDDLLRTKQALSPQTRLAYTALAGVLIAGMAAPAPAPASAPTSGTPKEPR